MPAPSPDARHIGDSLIACGIRLSLGGAIYNPRRALGNVLQILATYAEVGLRLVRTREGMAVARAKDKLKGRSPREEAQAHSSQQAEVARMHATGEYAIADLWKSSEPACATVYRTTGRQQAAPE